MPKEYVSSETIKEGLRQDVLWLLVTVYSYVTRRRFEGLGKMSREAFVVDCILLESAARDIVGRLTALDDDTKNNRSFQTLFVALKREGLDPKRTKDLDAKIKQYRKLVNNLKVSHRNRYSPCKYGCCSGSPRAGRSGPFRGNCLASSESSRRHRRA